MEGRDYTVVIDGANVAYYSQNHERGKFNYNQIAMVVAALERMGEKVLVVLPVKYTRKSWTVSSQFFTGDGRGGEEGEGEGGGGGFRRFKQRRTTEEKEFIEAWREKEQLYTAPALCLDDYYWMLASVTGGLGERGVERKEDSIFHGCKERLIISNDLLRDHNLEMGAKIGDLAFHRWVTTQFVGYDGLCLGWEDEDEGKELLLEMSKSTEEGIDWEKVDGLLEDSKYGVRFVPPDRFSVAVQKNKTPEGKEVWHLPIRGEGEDGEIKVGERHCVVQL